MNWKELDINKCIQIVDEWNGAPKPNVQGFYVNLADRLWEEYKVIDPDFSSKNKYDIDLEFGLKLYEILNNEFGFSLREASNDGIWRYISMMVIPNLSNMRWDGINEDYLFKISRRIWPKRLWWYIHLSWQGDAESTYKTLKNNTTDEILNLVERSGRDGYRVELYRSIMRKFSTINQNDKKRSQGLFRKVLKLNTALVQTIEPELFLGGIDGYVDYLFDFFIKQN